MSGLVNILLSGGEPIDPAYQAWLDQLALDGEAEPSPTVKNAQNAMFISLRAAGFLARAKFGYFLHCVSLQAGRRNIFAPANFRTTLGGTLVFSEGNGTRSNGTDGYINSTYAANQYAGIETDITIAALVTENANPASSGALYGCRVNGAFDTHILTPKSAASTGTFARHQGSGNNFNNNTVKGFYVDTYDGTNKVVYKDGVKTSTAITPGVPSISAPYLFLSRNASGLNGGVSPSTFFPYYTGLIMGFNRVNDADELALRTIVDAYELAAGLP